MEEKSFQESADEAIRLTERGMELLLEIERLCGLAQQLPKIEAYAELVKEIAEKEKAAAGLIGNATLIQRELLKRQRRNIEALIDDL